MTDPNALIAANGRRWAAAKVTRSFVPVTKRLVAPAAKARYQSVSAKHRRSLANHRRHPRARMFAKLGWLAGAG